MLLEDSCGPGSAAAEIRRSHVGKEEENKCLSGETFASPVSWPHSREPAEVNSRTTSHSLALSLLISNRVNGVKRRNGERPWDGWITRAPPCLPAVSSRARVLSHMHACIGVTAICPPPASPSRGRRFSFTGARGETGPDQERAFYSRSLTFSLFLRPIEEN